MISSQSGISDNLKLINELQHEIFPKLGITWGFHSGFILRIQVFYLTYLLQAKNFNYSVERHGIKLNFKSIFLLSRSLWHVVKFKFRSVANLHSDALVLGYKKNEINVRDKNVNIYAEPIKTKLNENGNSIRTLFLDQPSSSNDKTDLLIHNYYKHLIVTQTFFFSLLLKTSQYHRSQVKILKRNELMLSKWLKDKGVEKPNEIAIIISNAIIRNEVCYRTFEILSRIIKPKMIWTYCFYDNDVSAVTRVANANNIKVVEYQHSQQSDHHFAYAEWENIDRIREFFPSDFWVWRNSDKERILKNFSGKKYQPNVIVGGNLWLANFNKADKRQSRSDSVLISLQGFWIPDFIEEHIISDDQRHWYFRLHPRYPSDRDRLLNLYNRFPEKIIVEEANSLALYDLLSFVSINITSYSGVALEAYTFGVKNIIFGDQGLNSYKQYIERGVFDYVTNKESFERSMKEEYKKIDFDPVLDNIEQINESIKKLLV